MQSSAVSKQLVFVTSRKGLDEFCTDVSDECGGMAEVEDGEILREHCANLQG